MKITVNVVEPAVQKNNRRFVGGPASAYPIFMTPASIRLREANDVLVSALIVGCVALQGCAST
jgi:hypothetical protein